MVSFITCHDPQLPLLKNRIREPVRQGPARNHRLSKPIARIQHERRLQRAVCDALSGSVLPYCHINRQCDDSVASKMAVSYADWEKPRTSSRFRKSLN